MNKFAQSPLFLSFEPETLLSIFFLNHQRFKWKDIFSVSLFTVFFFLGELTVGNDKTIIVRPLHTSVKSFYINIRYIQTKKM